MWHGTDTLPMLANVPAKPPANETTSMGSFVPGDQEATEALKRMSRD